MNPIILTTFFLSVNLCFSQTDTTREAFEVIFGSNRGMSPDSIAGLPISEPRLIGEWELKRIKITNGHPKRPIQERDTVAIAITINADHTMTCISHRRKQKFYWTYEQTTRRIIIYAVLYDQEHLIETIGHSWPIKVVSKNKLIIDFTVGNNRSTRGGIYNTEYIFTQRKT